MVDLAEFRTRYLTPFERLSHLYEPERGFIVWRQGTGDNTELLHIKAAELRRGHGRWLVYRMLEHLEREPPYHSVYGYTRVSNRRAQAFYESLGFRCQRLEGIYRDGQAVLFWRDYQGLLESKEVFERGKAL